MPFDFGVGDFIPVGELAWGQYRYCYGAPQEFQLLLQEITSPSRFSSSKKRQKTRTRHWHVPEKIKFGW